MKFIFVFILTNIVFSAILFLWMLKFDREDVFSKTELFLYSLGLGPAVTTILLYYQFLLWPGQSNALYLSTVLLFYLAVLLTAEGSVRLLREPVLRAYRRWLGMRPVKRILDITAVFISITLTVFFIQVSIDQPLQGYDVSQYGTLGKIYFAEKSISLSGYHPYSPTGFHSTSTHPPSFPLLLTWEKILGVSLDYSGDSYFKSTQTYYTILIFAIALFWLGRWGLTPAVLGFFALPSAYVFYGLLGGHHIDGYRIFFSSVSWIMLAYALKKEDSLSFFLLAIFSGFAAFAHSIGFLICILNVVIFTAFSRLNKFPRFVLLSILVFFLGAAHYVFDILWGTGWHFSSTGKFYFPDLAGWLRR